MTVSNSTSRLRSALERSSTSFSMLLKSYHWIQHVRPATFLAWAPGVGGPQSEEDVMLKHISRRAMMAGAAAGMARGSRGNASAREVADLVRRTDQAATALIRGDINAYLELIRHSDDYTLMQPFGGSPTRG